MVERRPLSETGMRGGQASVDSATGDQMPSRAVSGGSALPLRSTPSTQAWSSSRSPRPPGGGFWRSPCLASAAAQPRSSSGSLKSTQPRIRRYTGPLGCRSITGERVGGSTPRCPTYVQPLPFTMAVLCSDDATCLFAGPLEADAGTRTHDLLHGKCERPFAPVRARSLKPPIAGFLSARPNGSELERRRTLPFLPRTGAKQ
jgi:hypothetical protein